MAKTKTIKSTPVLKAANDEYTGKVDNDRYEQPFNAIINFNYRMILEIQNVRINNEGDYWVSGDVYLTDSVTGMKFFGNLELSKME